jgi:hypothetical protein
MDKLQSEVLPIPEENGMCPKIAASVLNRKGYGINMPKAYCLYAVFVSGLQTALARQNKHLAIYEGNELIKGLSQLVKGQNDGFLYLSEYANPAINHYIPFIVEYNELNFYDAHDARLNVYRLRKGSNFADFSNDFHALFPMYQIQQVSLIVPNAGGKRKRRKTKRKTRKQRR